MAHKKRGNPKGRHKKALSPETQRWEREHLIPPCPPWMSQDMYAKLASLRAQEWRRT